MARIRSLKPDHKMHRKVGLLTDRQYRLWVGMITEADDEGRLNADAQQLRVVIFGYHPTRVTAKHVATDLEAVAAGGLIRLYHVGETLYADFPSWKDHQRVDAAHYRPSKLPPYNTSPRLEAQASLQVDSVEAQPGPRREGSGREGKGEETTLRPRDEDTGPSDRLTAERLIDLFNELTPDRTPAVVTRSPERIRKARQYLAKFPAEAFWRETFTQIHRSDFLRGLSKPTNGHGSFVADFDWLMSKGKDGTENAVKVHDGRYRNGA